MPSVLARLLLLLGAFSPVALGYAVVFLVRSQDQLALISFCAAVIGIAATVGFLRLAFDLSPTLIKVETAERIDEQILGYYASYAIPLVAILFTDVVVEATLVTAFFLLMGIFYIRNTLVHVNLILIFRYKFYKVGTKGGNAFTVLSRDKIKPGKSVPMIKISDGLQIVKRPVAKGVKFVSPTKHAGNSPTGHPR